MTALHCLESGQWKSLIVVDQTHLVLLDSTAKKTLAVVVPQKLERFYETFQIVFRPKNSIVRWQ